MSLSDNKVDDVNNTGSDNKVDDVNNTGSDNKVDDVNNTGSDNKVDDVNNTGSDNKVDDLQSQSQSQSQSQPQILVHSIKVDKTKLKTYSIPNPNQTLSDTAYNLVSTAIKGKSLSLNNIVEIARIALNIVSNLKRGKEKLTPDEIKAIVIQIIQKQVEQLPLDEENREFLINVVIPLMLPGIIDGLTVGIEVMVRDICGSCLLSCRSKNKTK
jgi:hypothetical protein